MAIQNIKKKLWPSKTLEVSQSCMYRFLVAFDRARDSDFRVLICNLVCQYSFCSFLFKINLV
jgi:hypothetical protein